MRVKMKVLLVILKTLDVKMKIGLLIPSIALDKKLLRKIPLPYNTTLEKLACITSNTHNQSLYPKPLYRSQCRRKTMKLFKL